MYPCRLEHNVESLNDKSRWLMAIGEGESHYYVMLCNIGSGVSSHMHAVLKTDYHPVTTVEKKAKHTQKEGANEFF
jgi:hypothetical protein